MSDTRFKSRLDKLKEIVIQEVNSYFNNELLLEYGMKASKFMAKYEEVLSRISDNLICICIFPNNPTVPHWQERAAGLCHRFADIPIEPLKNNKTEIRLKYLNKAVAEIFNKDFSALLNHFKRVMVYYANRPDPHERIISDKTYEECYNMYKEKVAEGIITLTRLVAEQNYEEILNYMRNFK